MVMKFDTGQIDASTVTAAILTLHVSSAGSGNNQFLVLGLPGACRPSFVHAIPHTASTQKAVQNVSCPLRTDARMSR